MVTYLVRGVKIMMIRRALYHIKLCETEQPVIADSIQSLLPLLGGILAANIVSRIISCRSSRDGLCCSVG